MIDNSMVTGPGLEQLRDLKNLERLSLPPTVDRLTPLRGLSRLLELGAWGAPIDDKGLEGIEDLKALERLHLGKTRLTDAGLARLRGLDKMQTLALFETSITDAGLANLAGMTRMTKLKNATTILGVDGLK